MALESKLQKHGEVHILPPELSPHVTDTKYTTTPRNEYITSAIYSTRELRDASPMSLGIGNDTVEDWDGRGKETGKRTTADGNTKDEDKEHCLGIEEYGQKRDVDHREREFTMEKMIRVYVGKDFTTDLGHSDGKREELVQDVREICETLGFHVRVRRSEYIEENGYASCTFIRRATFVCRSAIITRTTSLY